jgi:hypothetical protein
MYAIDRHGALVKGVVFALPVVLVALFGVLKLRFPDRYWSLIQEDAALESAQWILCGLGGGAAVAAALRRPRPRGRLDRAALLVLGSGLLLASLEEVSWGQRLLGLRTPEWLASRNSQREINLHNLYVIQARLHTIYFTAAAALVAGAVARPVLTAWSRAGVVTAALQRLLPPWWLALYFAPAALLYGFIRVRNGRLAPWMVWRDQEAAEAVLALGMFLLAVVLVRRVRTGPATAPRRWPSS